MRRERRRIGLMAALAALVIGWPARPLAQSAEQRIPLSLERMVELGLQNSYRVRDLQLNIERTRANLSAERAGLKSRVQLNVSAPQFESISEHKWNSAIQRDELVYENTRRWEADLSVRQPVILFGYPTNGELSFNNRLYRFSQFGEERDTRYYNRYFFGYEQPFFQPNRMKNDLENAELDLEEAELDYIDDVIGLVEDYADDYYELFEAAYDRARAEERVTHLEAAARLAAELAAAEPARAIEADQIRIELANAREELQQSLSSFRLQADGIKQDLRLSPAATLVLDPLVEVTAVVVDPDRAIELAKTLAPSLRQIGIERRKNEISLDNTRGTNSFRMNLSVTYGREVQDPRFQNLWHQPRNSYTVDLRAFVPIWDWGQRGYRIAASEIAVKRTDLQLEEELSQIETQVRSEIRTLEEYQQRALNMQENLALAHQITDSTLDRYRTGTLAVVDLLQTINREAGTAGNLFDAFMGYRRALLDLQQLTYFDFERNIPVTERFGISLSDDSGR